MYVTPHAPPIDEGAARDALGPFHETFTASILNAVESFHEDVAPGLPHFRQRTFCCYVQDKIETEMRTRCGGDDRVRFSQPGRDRFWMLVRWTGNDLLVRFKKLDSDGLTRNYPTRAARMFDNQVRLPGFPDAPRITVGFQTDGEGQLTDISVQLLNGKNRHWHYDLDMETAEVVRMPSRQTDLGDVAQTIQLKKSPKPKTADDDDDEP